MNHVYRPAFQIHIDFEYRSRKQAEALERARLLNEQAELLRKEADKLGKP
ncbi:hypothetical protein [Bacteroides intestinalis]|nr:hypothetical protein [Bacteroides intestinalis]